MKDNRVYIEFVLGMRDDQFKLYMELPPQRRDYLFELWKERNNK